MVSGLLSLPRMPSRSLMAQSGAAEIAHQHRRAIHLRHDDRADFLEIVNQAHAADHIALVAARDPATACVGVVIVDGVDDIRDAEAVVLELPWVEVELVLRREATEVRVVDDPWHRLPGPGSPSSAESPTAPAGSGCRIRAYIGRSRRPDRPRDRVRESSAGRQRRLVDALEQALPYPIILVAVAKNHRDQRQPEGARRAHQEQARCAVDLPFEGYRDQLLDFLSGETRHLCGDLGRNVAELGISLYRQRFPRIDAKAKEQRGQDNDRHPSMQTEADELVNH